MLDKSSSIDFYSLRRISGGKNTICKNPSKFKFYDENEKKWEKDGCHKLCKYCWHFSYTNGYYCNA